MDLSIVVVTWNAGQVLEDCLRSVYSETRDLEYEVLVVDNASATRDADMVEETFPEVRVIRNRVNVGFARASNQGLRLSTGRYVLLLNPDTRVMDRALSRMAELMDLCPDIGALGPKVMTPEGNVDLRGARRFPDLASELFELTHVSRRFPGSSLFGRYLMSDWDHAGSREVDALTGACLMVRREAIDQVGLLDERFFLYSEDVDYCYRLKKAGWRVWYDGDAAILHIGGQSTQWRRGAAGLERFRSRHAFFLKHRGVTYATAYRSLMLAITLTKGAVFGYRALASRDEGRRRCYRQKLGIHGRILQWVANPQTRHPESW